MINENREIFLTEEYVNIFKNGSEESICNQFGKTLTVLMTDIADYSKLMMTEGVVSCVRKLQAKASLIRPIIKENNGRIIERAGDSLMVLFPSSSAAIKTAIDIRKQLKDYNKNKEKAEQIYLAQGIASGSVLDFGHTIFGKPVIIASKLSEDIADDMDIFIEKSCFLSADGISELAINSRSKTISGINIDYIVLKT